MGLVIACGADTQTTNENPGPAQGKKRGGCPSRQKGNRLERAIVRLLQDKGFAAERVPLSGSAGGSYSGDLTGRDALVIRADRRDALVVLPLRLAAEIAIAAERRKA
jgi:hypothetical protein